MSIDKILNSITLESAEKDMLKSQTEDLISLSKELMNHITELETSLKETKMQLENIISKLNSSLGAEIQRKQPRMTVYLKDGTCTCGYKSKDISCKPNLKLGRWDIDGKLGRGFKKEYPYVTRLTGDTAPLADALVSYFKTNYRTL